MSRFTDYTDAADSGGVRVVWRADLVAPDGSLLATTDEDEAGAEAVAWGAEVDPLTYSTNRVGPRRASIRLPADSAGRFVPESTGSLLHPDAGNRVRLWCGIENDDGTPNFGTPQATMAIEETVSEYRSGATAINVSLVDALWPVRSELVDAFVFDDGEMVEDVAGRLLADVMDESQFGLTPTNWMTPGGSYGVGTSREELVLALLDGVGHELIADPYGFVTSRPIPPSNDSATAGRWSYGAPNIPVHMATKVNRSRVPQGWKVESGGLRTASTSVTVVVFDTDPTSEGFYSADSTSPHNLGSSRLPFVQGVAQSAVAGYAQLRRHGVGPLVVVFETIPNPMIRDNDLLELTLDDLYASGTYRVLDYSLPIRPSGLMTVMARQTYDPALNYEFPLDRGEGCVVSIADNFNRSDQNLENLEGSPGSDDWTEIGFSWGVEGQRAVQRSDGSWSMAFLNTPLCSSDQESSVEIVSVPSGRFVGPMVRSSGTFECYTALASSSGVVTLEMWQGGRRVSTLGSFSNGSSVAGQTLTVRAVQSMLEVDLGSTTVITANDSRRQGRFVGMLGYGGSPGNAPTIDNFAAGAAS